MSSSSETSNILGIDHETRLFESSISFARSRRHTGLNSDQLLARALQGCVRVLPQEWLPVYKYTRVQGNLSSLAAGAGELDSCAVEP